MVRRLPSCSAKFMMCDLPTKFMLTGFPIGKGGGGGGGDCQAPYLKADILIVKCEF